MLDRQYATNRTSLPLQDTKPADARKDNSDFLMAHRTQLTRDLVTFYLGNDAMPGCSTGWRLMLNEGNARRLLGAHRDELLRTPHPHDWSSSYPDDAGSFTDLQSRLERLYQQELRSVDGTTEIKPRRLSDTIFTEGIILYLDEASPEEPERVELVFIKPSGMDRTALLELDRDAQRERSFIAAMLQTLQTPESPQQGDLNSESADNILLADLESALQAVSTFVRMQLEKNNDLLVPLNSDTFEGTSQYIDLVKHLMRYNDVGSVIRSSLTQALSNPLSAYLWLRAQVQDRWKTRFNEIKRSYAQQFAQIRGRRNEASVKDDHEGKESADRDKRKLNKVIFDECAKEELTHVRNVLQEEEDNTLEDVVGIYGLYKAQRAILSAESSTTSELVKAFFEHQGSLTHTIKTEMSDLGAQCERLESALACINHTMQEVSARTKYLLAVDDFDEKMTCLRQRSSGLTSFSLMTDVCNDVQTTREVAQSLYDATSSIESGLGRVVGQALDVQILARDCIISSEIT